MLKNQDAYIVHTYNKDFSWQFHCQLSRESNYFVIQILTEKYFESREDETTKSTSNVDYTYKL